MACDIPSHVEYEFSKRIPKWIHRVPLNKLYLCLPRKENGVMIYYNYYLLPKSVVMIMFFVHTKPGVIVQSHSSILLVNCKLRVLDLSWLNRVRIRVRVL